MAAEIIDEGTAEAFLLTREWRDSPHGVRLELWAATDAGPLRITVPGQEAVCFVRRTDAALAERLAGGRARRRPLALRTLAGEPVDGLYFRTQRDLTELRPRARAGGLALLESDLRPADRFLMERFVTGAATVTGRLQPCGNHRLVLDASLRPSDYRPSLRCLAIDVEASALDGELYSVAVSDGESERVLMVDPEAGAGAPAERSPDGRFALERLASEPAVLGRLLEWVAEHDPDVLVGWNVIGFDLAFLESRCRAHGLAFTLGRGGATAAVLAPRGAGQVHIARVPGRAVLDGIDTLRAAFWSFEDFSLEAVGRELLGRGKLLHEGVEQVEAIRELFLTDKWRLAEYNLEDCRLVLDIFAHAGLVAFAVERAQITGLALGRVGGSVAAFDHLYLPRLHRRGRVAPDPGQAAEGAASPGGYILPSQPGLYRNVLVLDFKSLYPSIIRTFQIDPYGLAEPGEDPVEGFLGAHFARADGILPGLMTELSQRREAAKRAADAALSQAVKIIMNACYGVLASSGCRFSDPRLASSITRRGHEIIRRSRDFIEQAGYRVIYGDTDSLFVRLGEDMEEAECARIGEDLAARLNAWWQATIATEHRLASYLEVEFETHYLRFLMPTVRGADVGTKKRYAGYVRRADGTFAMRFKGLESVRTDWTPLARRFQRELYRRVFFDEPHEPFVRCTLEDLLAGKLDHELIYRKRLRRPIEEYRKSLPPHVQAARKLPRPGRWVSYLMTRDGPEPVERIDGIGARPDYDHYRERQLAPVADGILRFLDSSFAQITDAQLEIF